VTVVAAVQVTRYDAARLGNTRRTPQGFLRAPARVTRTGVLVYRRPDGTVVRELRRPEQVFKQDSVATLADAPVTDLHPREMITATNARTLSVGHVSGTSARADAGRYVEAELVITDGRMIKAIEAGDRREVSCGYSCKLIDKPGTYNGEHYDAEQTDIVYNHVGLGPQKWGRAGAEVALRLDGSADEHSLPSDAAHAVLRDDDDDNKGPEPMDLVTIRLDGLEAQVTPSAAQIVQRTLEQRDTKLAEQTTQLTALQQRFDALRGELDAAKTGLAEAKDPARFESAVRSRIALLERVRPVLGPDVKLDGLSPRDIKLKALAKLKPGSPSLEAEADAYIDARLDTVLEMLEAQPPRRGNPSASDLRRDLRAPTQPTAALDVRAILAGQTRADAAEPPKFEPPAWRTKLAASRE
jgi:uncharacterized protein